MIIDVVIPAYKVSNKICAVVEATLNLSWIRNIIVVDDACPELSGNSVQNHYNHDPRVIVLYHDRNLGVGGAVLTGYNYSFGSGADITIKIDGDGQMDPADAIWLVKPIMNKKCDYAKGNRFYNPAFLKKMPQVRYFGNSILSLVNKFISGYWKIMDPTNGFTALHRLAYQELDIKNIAKDYFFESDMLFHLSLISAVVQDIPMKAHYENEVSSLKITRIVTKFPRRYLNRLFKRIVIKYYAREFNFGSLELLFGIIVSLFGIIFGLWHWIGNLIAHTETPAGTVMIFGLAMIMGFQLILSFLNYDINNQPTIPLVSIRDYELINSSDNNIK